MIRLLVLLALLGMSALTLLFFPLFIAIGLFVMGLVSVSSRPADSRPR